MDQMEMTIRYWRYSAILIAPTFFSISLFPISIPERISKKNRWNRDTKHITEFVGECLSGCMFVCLVWRAILLSSLCQIEIYCTLPKAFMIFWSWSYHTKKSYTHTQWHDWEVTARRIKKGLRKCTWHVHIYVCQL